MCSCIDASASSAVATDSAASSALLAHWCRRASLSRVNRTSSAAAAAAADLRDWISSHRVRSLEGRLTPADPAPAGSGEALGLGLPTRGRGGDVATAEVGEAAARLGDGPPFCAGGLLRLLPSGDATTPLRAISGEPPSLPPMVAGRLRRLWIDGGGDASSSARVRPLRGGAAIASWRGGAVARNSGCMALGAAVRVYASPQARVRATSGLGSAPCASSSSATSAAARPSSRAVVSVCSSATKGTGSPPSLNRLHSHRSARSSARLSL